VSDNAALLLFLLGMMAFIAFCCWLMHSAWPLAMILFWLFL
jgi:hypothetical protein